MKKLITLILLMLSLTSISQVYKSTKVYYNVVDSTYTNWLSQYHDVDYIIYVENVKSQIDTGYSYLKVQTTNFEDSYFILYDTLHISKSISKYLAFDYRGVDCIVSFVKGTDTEQYLILQYPDMGWCCQLELIH